MFSKTLLTAVKAFITIAVVLLISSTSYAQLPLDSVQYYKGGILYMEMKLKKTGDVGSVLLKNPDPEVQLHFDKYKSNSAAMRIFSLIGGFGLGYSVGTVIGGGKMNPAIFGTGAGALLTGLIFNGKANKKLRLSVNAYNASFKSNATVVPSNDH